MVNEIIESIAARLRETFGPDTKIFTGDGKQDLQKPCFLIQLISRTSEPKIAGRSRLLQSFQILYYPQNENDPAGLYSVAEQAEAALEFIRLPSDDSLHGTKITSQIADSVLHVTVNYNLFTVQRTEKDKMETASVHSGLKG